MGEKNKKSTGIATKIAIFVIGFVLGLGSLWLWSNSTIISMPEAKEEENEEVKEEVVNRSPIQGVNTSQSNRLVVPDQEAGGVVSIQYVLFTEPGWVVIHELLSDGALGNALGAQRFDVGEYTGAVSLLRVTEVGINYTAVLYKDNGDRRFDLDLDLPIRNNSNNIIQAKFNIVK